MSFNVLPFGSRPIAGSEQLAAPSSCDPGGGPGEVVDLASRRAPAIPVPDIPEDVLDEVDAAAELWHELRATGQEVRFDPNAATGRVVASLRDVDGGVVRALRLREVVGLDDDGPQSAA
jgi:hypothetical protein